MIIRFESIADDHVRLTCTYYVDDETRKVVEDYVKHGAYVYRKMPSGQLRQVCRGLKLMGETLRHDDKPLYQVIHEHAIRM